MAKKFHPKFETWLEDQLLLLRNHAERRLKGKFAHLSDINTSSENMTDKFGKRSPRKSNSSGDYYKFVWNEDEDSLVDDDVDSPSSREKVAQILKETELNDEDLEVATYNTQAAENTNKISVTELNPSNADTKSEDQNSMHFFENALSELLEYTDEYIDDPEVNLEGLNKTGTHAQNVHFRRAPEREIDLGTGEIGQEMAQLARATDQDNSTSANGELRINNPAFKPVLPMDTFEMSMDSEEEDDVILHVPNRRANSGGADMEPIVTMDEGQLVNQRKKRKRQLRIVMVVVGILLGIVVFGLVTYMVVKLLSR